MNNTKQKIMSIATAIKTYCHPYYAQKIIPFATVCWKYFISNMIYIKKVWKKTSFPDAIKNCFKKYFVFKGRATRSEYWWLVLLVWIFWVVVITLLKLEYYVIADIFGIALLALIIPLISVCARRLHDTGRSGWWQASPLLPGMFLGFFLKSFGANLLIIIIPLGIIQLGIYLWLFFILCQKGKPEANKYGEPELSE